MSKPNPKQQTTDKWTDSLGQEFGPGDLISVAVINGRSPQMVIARVERINTTDPKGEPHVRRRRTGRKVPQEYARREYAGPPFKETGFRGNYAEARAARDHNDKLTRDPANWRTWTETRQVDEWEETQNVTVTAVPILDGRGFRRSNPQRVWTGSEYVTDPTKPKARTVTYTLMGNIIRLPEHVTEERVEELAKTREVEY